MLGLSLRMPSSRDRYWTEIRDVKKSFLGEGQGESSLVLSVSAKVNIFCALIVSVWSQLSTIMLRKMTTPSSQEDDHVGRGHRKSKNLRKEWNHYSQWRKSLCLKQFKQQLTVTGGENKEVNRPDCAGSLRSRWRLHFNVCGMIRQAAVLWRRSILEKVCGTINFSIWY